MDNAASNNPPDEESPSHVKYWLTATDENDCFFSVGPESGPVERIGAFRAFLMGYSEPFRVMLGRGELSEQGGIRIPDIMPETFKTFLKCIYHGKCDAILEKLNFEDSCNLLHLVEKYMVTSFKVKLTGHMVKMLGVSKNNVFTALKHPVCFQEQTLQSLLSKLVWLKTKEIISNHLFLEIGEDGMMFIVKQPFLSVPEVLIWKALIEWAGHPVKNDEGEVSQNREIGKFLKEIHFTDMSCEEFCTEVIPRNILAGNIVVDLCKSFQEKTTSTSSLSNDSHPSHISFSYTIRNISRQYLIKCESSSSYNFQNFTFSLQVREYQKGNSALYLACESRSKSRIELSDEETQRILCTVNADLIIVGQYDYPNYLVDLNGITFKSINQRLSRHEIGHLKNLLKPPEEFIRDGSAMFVINIRLK